MDRYELIKLIIYQSEREEADAARKENDRRIFELTDKISELTEQPRKSNETTSLMSSQMSELPWQLKDKDRKIAELQSTAKVACKTCSGANSRMARRQSTRMTGTPPTPHKGVKSGFNAE